MKGFSIDVGYYVQGQEGHVGPRYSPRDLQ
jgi:hypothetical protein